MTIQGGGGGKKIPPGGTPVPPKAPKAESSTPGAKAPAAAKDAQPAKEAHGAKADAFVRRGGDAGPFKSTSDVRLDDAFLHATTPSGIDSLVRMLESARAQLFGEHKSARAEASKLLERLVSAGFADAQLQSTRQELYELRRRMAAVRKRLQHLQRRLKSAFAQAGKTADANLQKALGAQLERLKQLEPGMARSLGALALLEQAYGAFADGSPPVLRAKVGDKGSAELVESLSALAPGDVAARVVQGILSGGPDAAPPPGRPRPAGAHEPDVAAGLRAFADALAPPRSGEER